MRVQILTQPVGLSSCGLEKVTDLWWWAMLGSSGSTVAGVVHPAPVAASNVSLSWRTGLEPLEPTPACWDPQPVMSGPHSYLWGITAFSRKLCLKSFSC